MALSVAKMTWTVEVLQQVVEAEQDAAFAALDEIDGDREVDDRGVERLGAERRDPGWRRRRSGLG